MLTDDSNEINLQIIVPFKYDLFSDNNAKNSLDKLTSTPKQYQLLISSVPEYLKVFVCFCIYVFVLFNVYFVFFIMTFKAHWSRLYSVH